MRYRTGVLASVILLAALSRLLPHPPNFTPIAGMALFGAATFPRRRTAFLVPLAAMAVSDLALEATARTGVALSGWLAQGYGLHRGMAVIYALVAATAVIGLCLRNRRTPLAVAAATVAASVLFYLGANFAVWAGGGMYPRTAGGLWACYAAALPFFRLTLLGNAFYATVLFGGLAVAERVRPQLVLRPGDTTSRPGLSLT